MFAYLKNLRACRANWCEDAISYFTKLRNVKSQTLGSLLTCHKKKQKMQDFKEVKHAGLSIRMALNAAGDGFLTGGLG